MFVHLRLHSEFSIQDGIVRIGDAVSAAARDGQPALALTDWNNLFGAIKFYQIAQKKGVQPILGAEVTVAGLRSDVAVAKAAGASSATQAAGLPRMLLLVQDQQGYLNLCELLSRIWQGAGCAQWSWLCELSQGLILLSGAQAGPLGMALLAGHAAQAQQMAQQMAQTFAGRFYVELQRVGRSSDEPYIAAALQLAADMGLPVVATHPIQFMQPEEFEAHEARVCIADGEILGNQRRVRRFTHQQYFHSTEQMQALFADIPSAIDNTVEIARRTHLTLNLGQPRLPDYPIPPGMTVEAYFRQQAEAGLQQRLLARYPDAAQRQQQEPAYTQRLEFELGTIEQMGFTGYFLIVADFINWAKNNGCPVGPGRGSGAGSLVAYVLGITDLDPLQYNLLFERFLNPERVSMPDFDIDFCQANRDRVIEYVKEKYGRDAVSQIATFGTMAARAAIRDVGRVLDLSYSFCDGISKLIPNKPGKPVTLQYPPDDLEQRIASLGREKQEDERNKYALLASPDLKSRIDNDEEVRMLVEMAQKLEGITRNIGMHAGGVLIAPGKLTDFCPLYQQPGHSALVSQYDKDDVEAVGLVKFDFLGLATLTIMHHAATLIRSRRAGMENFSFDDIPLDDADTFALFQGGRTEAVFQFESTGMQKMLKEARPTRLEDLIALNALYRPGPMDLIPDFIARKHGRQEITYPHPQVEEVLRETYGIMVYQEQVMQTAQVLGGYSLGGADLLRRAMGKKKPEEMAKHRLIFREGAAKNGISEQQADDIFNLMEQFAGYGFNKSHAAAYSLLAYQTGWLKAHYTVEFFCANMTVEMDNTDKLHVLYQDAIGMGLHFAPPDVNRSVYHFFPLDDHTICYGLGAIKGTGEAAISAIVAARETGGPFHSLFDFCNRIDRSRLNKRTVEALIRGGAFDSLNPHRAALLASMDVAFEYAARQAANAQQVGLFDMLEDTQGSSTQEPELADVPPWGLREQLAQEKSAIGFYLSGHLFDEYEAEIRRFVPNRLVQYISKEEGRERYGVVLLAGMISDMRIINTRQSKRMVLFRLDDKTASMEASADESLLAQHAHVLKDDMPVVIQATPRFDRFTESMRLTVHQVWSLPAARCCYGQYICITTGILQALPQPTTAAQATQLARDFAPQRDVLEETGDVIQRSLPVRLHTQIQVQLPAALDMGHAYAHAMSADTAADGDRANHSTAVIDATGPAGKASTASSTALQGTLVLDEALRTYPSDEALAAWQAIFAGSRVEVVYRPPDDRTWQ